MVIPTRKIGSTEVSAIGYGAMGISVGYGDPLPDEERLKVLDAVYERGCTNWDTADVYGDSEELLGKWYVVPISLVFSSYCAAAVTYILISWSGSSALESAMISFLRRSLGLSSKRTVSSMVRQITRDFQSSNRFVVSASIISICTICTVRTPQCPSRRL